MKRVHKRERKTEKKKRLVHHAQLEQNLPAGKKLIKHKRERRLKSRGSCMPTHTFSPFHSTHLFEFSSFSSTTKGRSANRTEQNNFPFLLAKQYTTATLHFKTRRAQKVHKHTFTLLREKKKKQVLKKKKRTYIYI